MTQELTKDERVWFNDKGILRDLNGVPVFCEINDEGYKLLPEKVVPASELERVKNILKNLVESKVVKSAPMIGYSEAYANAKEYLEANNGN